MSTIQDLFQQAQLAEATYADFSNPNISQATALENEGFSPRQSADFLAHWRMVNQSPAEGFFGSGFSATLFEQMDAKQQPTAQYTLAIAGSTSFTDFFFEDFASIAAGGVAFECSQRGVRS
jgi:hypothetical protein